MSLLGSRGIAILGATFFLYIVSKVLPLDKIVFETVTYFVSFLIYLFILVTKSTLLPNLFSNSP
jgi:Mg2+/Co2+ transporter CorB